MIPNILFTYWEGDNLSYFNYLTILSLHTYNPDKQITIYTSKTNSQTLISWNSNEHTVPIEYKLTLADIQQISQDHITIVPIDFGASYQLDNNLSCVFKADIIRIYKLHEHGGMWFDFDILFIKPIPAHIFTSPDIDFLYYVYCGVIPTGLLISTPNNRVTTAMYHNAKTLVTNPTRYSGKIRYQLFGPELWRKTILFSKNKSILSTSKLLDTAEIYPYLYNELDQLYTVDTGLETQCPGTDVSLNSRPPPNICSLLLDGSCQQEKREVGLEFSVNGTTPEKSKITECTWGIHWYNGDSTTKHFINNYCKTPEPDQSIMHKYITQILTDAGDTVKSQLLVHPKGVRNLDFRYESGVYR